MRIWTGVLALSVLCAVLLATGAFAADSIGEPGRGSGEPNALKNVYFGEQHVHTVNSPDAFAFGTRNTPDDAYRFCKGEPIKIATTGETVQKKTPQVRLASTGSVSGEPVRFFSTPATTAVWAPENTREAIFDGIKSKETYGTSGTFIRLRFFGGWSYPKGLVRDKKFVEKAYRDGVPMGGDLPKKSAKAKAPTFAVWALKDPESGNLDRIQIVKGWFERGYAFEKVYDVVWSDADKRKMGVNGKLPPVGNTVNIKKATYTNDIGDTQLSTVWTDPDFNVAYHAVYYVRVIEIPTPRWTTYDAKALGVDPPADVAPTIQERAWSSPIWYTPAVELVKKPDRYYGLQPYLP